MVLVHTPPCRTATHSDRIDVHRRRRFVSIGVFFLFRFRRGGVGEWVRMSGRRWSWISGQVGRTEDAGFLFGDKAAYITDEGDDVGRFEKGGDVISNVVVVLIEARVKLVNEVDQRNGTETYSLGRNAMATGRGERIHQGFYGNTTLVVLY